MRWPLAAPVTAGARDDCATGGASESESESESEAEEEDDEFDELEEEDGGSGIAAGAGVGAGLGAAVARAGVAEVATNWAAVGSTLGWAGASRPEGKEIVSASLTLQAECGVSAIVSTNARAEVGLRGSLEDVVRLRGGGNEVSICVPVRSRPICRR